MTVFLLSLCLAFARKDKNGKYQRTEDYSEIDFAGLQNEKLSMTGLVYFNTSTPIKSENMRIIENIPLPILQNSKFKEVGKQEHITTSLEDTTEVEASNATVSPESYSTEPSKNRSFYPQRRYTLEPCSVSSERKMLRCIRDLWQDINSYSDFKPNDVLMPEPDYNCCIESKFRECFQTAAQPCKESQIDALLQKRNLKIPVTGLCAHISYPSLRCLTFFNQLSLFYALIGLLVTLTLILFLWFRRTRYVSIIVPRVASNDFQMHETSYPVERHNNNLDIGVPGSSNNSHGYPWSKKRQSIKMEIKDNSFSPPLYIEFPPKY